MITDVAFQNPDVPFECELLRLESLFQRRLDHSLEQPQRLGFYLLILILQGQGRHRVDFQSYPYTPRSLFCLAENQVQQFEVNPASRGYLLLFTRQFFYQTPDDQAFLQGSYLFDFSLQAPVLNLSEAEDEFFRFGFEQIEQELTRPAPDAFREAIVRNLLRTLLLRAERLKQVAALPQMQSHYGEFSRFKGRLEADFSRTRNVQDYAAALGSSTKRLNQLTRLILNRSAKEYIDERVVLEIKRLLVHTGLSVKEISLQTGFDEPTNLVKFFKRYTGQTPLAFRASFH